MRRDEVDLHVDDAFTGAVAEASVRAEFSGREVSDKVDGSVASKGAKS